MTREDTEAAAADAAACLLLSPEAPPERALPASATFPVVLSTTVALCGSYIFGNALGFSSPAESGIREDLGLSLAEYSLFGSILSVGAVVGALLSGRIADLIGRRGAMWVSDVICILGWLLIGFAQDALWLDCGRALLGCGIGLLTYAVPVYIAEITPKNLRGGFTALHEFVLGCSSSVAYLVGSLVHWRVFALLGLIPCLIQFLGLLFVCESPRWLVKVGRVSAFEASLRWLRGKNVDIYPEAAEIKDYTVYLERVTQKRFLDMFQRKYARCLIVGVGLMVFQQFGGMKGVLFYTTAIFKSAGFPGKLGSILAATTKIAMSAAGVVLLTVYGRRPLLLVSAAGACLGALITALSFLSTVAKELRSVSFLIGMVVFIGAYELGLGSIPWIIMSEIYPINIKGMAGSLSNLVSWFGSWAVSYSFNYLFEWSSAGTFFIYSCICGAAVLFIARLVPETRGRTLEEIQVSITERDGF